MKDVVIDRILKRKSTVILLFEFVLLLFALFTSLIFNQFNFLSEFIISIIVLTLLFLICKWLLEKYVYKEDRRLLLFFTLLTSIIGFVIYFAVVYGREYTYESDHVVYYNLQNELKTLFIDSPLNGLLGILFSCWQSDYSYFINLFLAAPFQFTDGSNEAFVMTYYLVLLVPVFFVNNIWLFDIIKRVNIKRKRTFIFLGNVTFLCFPLIHFASLLGMPDLFGMFFVISIVIMLSNFDFIKFDKTGAIILSLLFVCLAVTRRWYIFWMLGFVPVFLIITFLLSLYGRDTKKIKKTLFNEIKLIICACCFVVIMLAPFIYNTLFQRNYSEDYSEWYLGGFWFELYNQLGYLGLLLSFLMLIGIIYGFVNKQLRPICFVSVIGYFVSIYFFTTIQNMGKHQSLLLVMYYLLFIYMFFCLICKLKSKIISLILVLLVILVIALNILSTYYVWVDDLNGLFFTTKYAISKRFVWK